MPSVHRPRRRWRRYFIELIIVVAVFGAIQAWNSRGSARGPAPALAGVDTTASAVSLPAAPGRPTVVHFWATWCGICEFMDESVSALAQDHAVVTVALRSGPPSAVAAHLLANDLDFSAIVDEQGINGARWGVRGVPTTFFLDADGKIQDVTVGYTSWLGLRLRLWRVSG